MSLPIAMSVTQAAEQLGVSEWLIRREIAAGRLPHTHLGRRLVVPTRALEAHLNAVAASAVASTSACANPPGAAGVDGAAGAKSVGEGTSTPAASTRGGEPGSIRAAAGTTGEVFIAGAPPAA